MASPVSMLSFRTIGTPCSGPRAPEASRSRSRSAAIRRASGFVSRMDRSVGPPRSMASMRSRYARVISSALVAPDAIRPAGRDGLVVQLHGPLPDRTCPGGYAGACRGAGGRRPARRTRGPARAPPGATPYTPPTCRTPSSASPAAPTSPATRRRPTSARSATSRVSTSAPAGRCGDAHGDLLAEHAPRIEEEAPGPLGAGPGAGAGDRPAGAPGAHAGGQRAVGLRAAAARRDRRAPPGARRRARDRGEPPALLHGRRRLRGGLRRRRLPPRRRRRRSSRTRTRASDPGAASGRRCSAA
jgi:hypothetical protein